MNCPTPQNDPPQPQRRSFFTQFWAAIVAALCGLVPLTAAVGFLLGPLRRHTGATEDQAFVPLGIGPDALPPDGSPMAVSIVTDKQDAWNVHLDQPIGSVWLRKDEQGNVVAMATICPHLGCFVDYRAGQRDFYCPCHASTFELTGKRVNRIPPRDMDTLDVEIRDDTIWVRFQKFRGATSEKIPV